MRKTVDIVVPVYNEPENLQTFYQSFVSLVHSDWRLLIVYDFEEDSSLPVARKLKGQDSRVCIVKNNERGVLGAIKSGFAAAESSAICTVMVDDPPSIIESLDRMTTLFYSEDATIVVASRYMKGGSHTGGPVIKGLLSRLAGVSLHALIRLPTHDATYNTRIYRKSFLKEISIESNRGFEVALEITLKAHLMKRKILEIPVHWTEREVGMSNFRLVELIRAYLYWYWYGIVQYWFVGKKY